VSDADDIRNLLGRYCELMDAADWVAVGQLFAHAELATPDGAVIAAGAASVQAMYERGTKLYEGSPRTRHITANSIVEVSGDAAIARSSFVVFQAVDGFALQPIVTGRYRDEFVHDTGVWRFARRQFLLDQVGDLSNHLTYEVQP
jgi:3-phenylpropionate/cinnamic acid dioxygenase small subunit